MTLLLLAVLSWIQETDVPIAIPLKGLMAGCCEKPVQEELARVEGVKSAAVKKAGGAHVAEVVMKPGAGLPLSAVEKALAKATEGMGKAMGTAYAVDASFAAAWVHLFTTREKPDEAKLQEALGKLKGFSSVKVAGSGFRVAFEGKEQATVAEVRKAVETTDAILAATKDGARGSCPMHPDVVNPAPMKCPTCNMDLERVSAAAPPAAPAKPAGAEKKGG
jgi:hypothetical protein